jgi:intracellular sulfur oxidation DsrE/DsrF family protein
LDLVTKNKSVNEPTVAKLAAGKNVTFSVCEVAMKKHNVEAGNLIPGVTTVPDGLYELVKKQQAGWGYIKVTD